MTTAQAPDAAGNPPILDDSEGFISLHYTDAERPNAVDFWDDITHLRHLHPHAGRLVFMDHHDGGYMIAFEDGRS